MNKTITLYFKQSKAYLLIVGFISTFLLTSACHGDHGEVKIPTNKVLVLKFDEESKDFNWGREYLYYDHPETFTVTINKEMNADGTVTSIFYKEENALLLKATAKHAPLEGEILIPEDFKPADYFERVTTNDFVTPMNGYKELSEDLLPEVHFENMWSKVQSLKNVREYLQRNPSQQVQVFLYKPTIDSSINNRWIFVLKN